MNTLIKFAVVSLLLTNPIMASIEKPTDHSQYEILTEQILTSELLGNMRVESKTGIPRAIYSPQYKVQSDSPERMALSYLDSHIDLLRHENDLSEISYVRTIESLSGQRVQFMQTIHGYNVFKASIKVSLNHNDEVVFVTNGFQDIKTIRNSIKLDQETATLRALDHLDLETTPFLERSEIIVYPRPFKTGLYAYQVTIVPGGDHYGDWEILVDAENGQILRAEDKACYQHTLRESGSAWVFDPDPVTDAQAYYGGNSFSNFGDADNDSLTAHLQEVVLEDITFRDGQYRLEGPYASIIDIEAPYSGFHEQDSSNFYFTRSEDGFEAANTYYHIHETMQYLNDSLGFDIMPYQYEGGVTFDPRALNGDANAYFSSSTGWVAFGVPANSVDAAEDHAIVLHEIGHGIHDWATVGGLSQVDGLSEGLGDYWAQSYTRSLGKFAPGDPQYNYFGLWGLQPFGNPSLRVTDFPNHYPEGLGGEVHYDGQLWASTLMTIFDNIGRTATDTDCWEAISMTDMNTNQMDAAFAFLQADLDLYGGVNLPGIMPAFIDRGYLPGPLVARFDADVTGGEGPLSVTFEDLSFVYLAPISTYSWDFENDGIIDSNDPNPTHVYTEPGLYSVALTISDGTDSHTTIVDNFISVNDGVLVFDGREPGNFVRDYSGAFIYEELTEMGIPASYSNRLWSTLAGYDAVFISLGNLGEQGEDGTILGDKDITALVEYLTLGGSVYAEGGSLMGGVLMFGTGDHQAFWDLFGVATAEFNFVQHNLSVLEGQPGSVGENLTYNGSTQVNSWYIDDVSPNENGEVIFSEPGYGNVAIQSEGIHGQRTVYSAYSLANLIDGDLQNTRHQLLLNVLEYFGTPILSPAFSANVTSGHAPLLIQFSDVSGANPNVLSWAWDFNGDGVVDSEEEDPQWTYETPGNYAVSLTVENADTSRSIIVGDAIRVFDGESALQFHENDHSVLVNQQASLNAIFGLTVEAWIKPLDWGDEGDGDGRIVDKGYYRLFLNKDGSSTYPDSTLAVIIKHEDGTLSKASAHAHDIVLNEWQHIAVSYDGVDSELNIFINGVDRTLIYTAPSSIIKDNGDKDLFIGNSSNHSKGFQGLIDELRIWDMAISDTDINAHIDGYLAGTENGLAAYYQMNEAYGSMLMDGSSNGNHGSINHSTWEIGTDFVVPVSTEPEVQRPVDRLMVQSYPNPFNASTQIRYALPQATQVELSIFNLKGEEIYSRSAGQQTAGWYQFNWQGDNAHGETMPTGLYFFRVTTGSEAQTLKLLMIK